MALTGFDPNEVIACTAKIQKSYTETYQVLLEDNQAFVNGMADVWACNEAIEFFTNFKSKEDILTNNVTNIFSEIYQTICDAGNEWAETTGSNFTRPTFAQNSNKINVDCIKENINGVRGVDKDLATEQLTILENIPSKTEETLQIALTGVNSAAAFFGGNQQANLQDLIKNISNQILQTTTVLTDECDTSINQTIDNYEELEQQISEAFEIDKSDIDFSQIATNANDASNGNFLAEDKIKKDYWGDTTDGKLEYQIRDDGTVLITEDGVPMGYTTQEALGLSNNSSTPNRPTSADKSAQAAQTGSDTYAKSSTAPSSVDTNTSYSSEFRGKNAKGNEIYGYKDSNGNSYSIKTDGTYQVGADGTKYYYQNETGIYISEDGKIRE